VIPTTALLLELGLILLALGLLGTLARRLRVSPIPFYLLVGLALGKGGLAGVEAAGQFIEIGASIGVVLLLLMLGLEFTLSEFVVSMRRHVSSAVIDLVLGAAPGVVAGLLLGLSGVQVFALAGITYVSSSGIVARLLSDLGWLANRETPAVLSVLVLEDFAMALFLPVLTVLAAGGSWGDAALGIALAVGAITATLLVSYRWGHHLGRLVAHPDPEPMMLRLLGVTLIVAALAELIHISAAVGAFLVGLSLGGGLADRARALLGPLRDLFAAAFFLAIGFSVGPRELLPMLPAAIVLAVATAAAKLAIGWHAARREGARRPGRLRAGAALVAHGEFSIVILGLLGTAAEGLGPLVVTYVLLLAAGGPVLARWIDDSPWVGLRRRVLARP
jgi:K+:H+ antiporter subunit KhtU